MNTPHEAEMLASDIHALMSRLATLDLQPLLSGAEIDAARRDAEEATRELLTYLLTSENFAPVAEEAGAVQEWQLVAAPTSECALTVWDEA